MWPTVVAVSAVGLMIFGLVVVEVVARRGQRQVERERLKQLDKSLDAHERDAF